MEDLLQAQFDNQLNLLLFDGAVTFSIDELIKQINKSEWTKRGGGWSGLVDGEFGDFGGIAWTSADIVAEFYSTS